MIGVIPRAAIALFEKLGTGLARQTSGLKTPTRFSTSSPASFAKPAEKNWTMKATYVEVSGQESRLSTALTGTLDLQRAIARFIGA
jgi:hypothetical protein